MKKNKLVLFIIVPIAAAAIAAIGALLYFRSGQPSQGNKTACTMEAKLCPDGTYVGRMPPKCDFAPCPEQTTSTLAKKDDMIEVYFPKPNEEISSPLFISGQARGPWYFEAVFPVKILDENGKELGKTAARAKGEWTTGNFVPYEATLDFETPSTKNGVLVLEKDNPSGLPQNADKLEIPVVFKYFYSDKNAGSISGKISIGPFCPAEREGSPCPKPADLFASRRIELVLLGGDKSVNPPIYIKINSDGTFSSDNIPAGNYSLSMTNCNFLGCSYKFPEDMKIKTGQTAEINIDIDTGIR